METLARAATFARGVPAARTPASSRARRAPVPARRARATRRRGASATAVALDDDAVASPPPPPSSSSAPTALDAKALGIERGQTLPPVPPERVHWVCDVAGVEAMRAAVLSDERNPTTAEGHPPVVGLDGEWKPGSRTPVSILQVATRADAFVVDLFATAPPDAPASDALDAFLADLLGSERIYKLGFSFGYDLSRMRASYPHLRSLRVGAGHPQPRAMIDVKQVANVASANRMNTRVGLATLTKFTLGATLSKAEQCSDWSRRPLTAAQLSYAAADAFYLCVIFDKCVFKSNGKVLTRLEEIVLLGDPREKGKHLPRKAKKAFKKQAELARRLQQQVERAGGKVLGHAQREADARDVIVDVPTTLSSVGKTVDGGRRGAARLLGSGKDVRASKGAARGAAVERWANAAVLYLSVGDPKKGTAGGKGGAFWEEDGDVLLKPSDACFAGAAEADVRVFSAASSDRIGSVAEVAAPPPEEEDVGACPLPEEEEEGEGEGGDGGCGGEAEPEAEAEAEASGDGKRPADAALLFMRRPPGPFAYCGRLEAVEGSGNGDEIGGGVGTLRVVDGAALRSSPLFHQLIGCRLLPRAPE